MSQPLPATLCGQDGKFGVLMNSDVRRLAADRSTETRAATVAKVAAEFARGSLGEEERRLALDIFAVAARDVETRVRQALAEQLKSSTLLPRPLACQFAEDVEAVAVPILELSSVLTDSDLISIVRGGNTAKQVAVARRRTVSAELSEAIVDTGKEAVIGTLVANPGADIAESSLERVVDFFGDSEGIQRALVERYALPLPIVEKLAAKISDTLRARLVERQNLPSGVAESLAVLGRERAVIDIAESEASAAEMMGLINHLYKRARLTPTILLRALCIGDLGFFVAGTARLAGITIEAARDLAREPGPTGIQSLCLKAGLPVDLHTAYRVGVELAMETAQRDGPIARETHVRRVIAQLLRHYEDVCPEGLEHVLATLRRRFVPDIAAAPTSARRTG